MIARFKHHLNKKPAKLSLHQVKSLVSWLVFAKKTLAPQNNIPWRKEVLLDDIKNVSWKLFASLVWPLCLNTHQPPLQECENCVWWNVHRFGGLESNVFEKCSPLGVVECNVVMARSTLELRIEESRLPLANHDNEAKVVPKTDSTFLQINGGDRMEMEEEKNYKGKRKTIYIVIVCIPMAIAKYKVNT